ncbi:MAG: sulfur transferase domain-containing protein, partial [Sphingomonadaceae bacterium]|nr:sulfur transferase domain-containing protein [Sphingomonadaceae bacterium]
MFIRINDAISVAGQLSPADLAEAKAQGFALVINNRPDGEAADQPPGSAMAEAAAANGLAYLEIPIAGGFSMPQVEA